MIGRITFLPLTEPAPTHWQYTVSDAPIDVQRQAQWPKIARLVARLQAEEQCLDLRRLRFYRDLAQRNRLGEW